MPCERRIWPIAFFVLDGKEALDFLSCRGAFAERSFNHSSELVLLDWKLPKVDGPQVSKELKNDSRTRSIPVVITAPPAERDTWPPWIELVLRGTGWFGPSSVFQHKSATADWLKSRTAASLNSL
jgi:CheY-like chemotaxis protein